MARIKRAVNAVKKRRKIFKLSKGYFGAKSRQYRVANQAVMNPYPMPMWAAACVSVISAACGSSASMRPPI